MVSQKILKDPEQLKRLYAIREKLLGTDRDDHLNEISEWEKRIKQALIALSLKGHEGVKMLIDRAEKEITDIDQILRSVKPDDLSPNGALKYAYENLRLFDRKVMWEWFKEFFDEAEIELKAADEFLALQEAPEESEDTGY